jgi:hypothetical protein
MVFLYLDPGGGSLLIQLLIAGFLGFTLYIKRIYWFIRITFFGKKKFNDTEVSADDETES